MRKWSWIVVSLFVLACGGAGSASSAEGGGDGTAGGEGGGSAQDELRAAIAAMIVAPERPWSEMSHEERGNDMVMR
ncbi:MAG TPA: hypothetical protein VIL20_28240, partial [Sandaracinaceae bacterium]